MQSLDEVGNMSQFEWVGTTCKFHSKISEALLLN